MKRWVVVRTGANKELWAAQNVVAQGHDYYLPRVLELQRGRGKQGLLVAKPLFPRYLFVHTVDGQWRFLLGTFGVTGIILTGDTPAFVPDEDIAAVRDREHEGNVILPKEPEAGRFKEGQRVRIKSGVFSGQVGIYSGMGSRDREKVLLDYLGRRTSVLIADDLLDDV